MRFTLLLLLALLTFPCTGVRAQITDDFEDGDLENPTWFGDTEDFQVSDGRLRLMADGAGESRLSINLPPSGFSSSGVEIGMLVDMDFSPSASNYATILLEQCQAGDCGVAGILRFGGISGSDDRLEVSLQDFDLTYELFGAVGALGTDPANVRFELIFADNSWTLSTDYTTGNNLVDEDTVEGSAFGFNRLTIVCNYTATRADKFSFDDFTYTTEAPDDGVPPVLIDFSSFPGPTFDLIYDESLDEGFMSNLANYSLSNGIEIIDVSVIGREVKLFLSESLPSDETIILTIGGARDLAGNEAGVQTLELFFESIVLPNSGNVLINEFMADPNPVVGLPNEEYVELYNPTDTAVFASSLSIASGGTPVDFPDGTRIPANGYLIVTGGDAAEFEALGATVVSLNLPSLTNGGDVISLFANGELLQEITYTEAWYNDPERDEGGYSIEYVGAGADAGCSGSWKASEDVAGGTPGRGNSVVGRVVDSRPPTVTGFSVTASTIEIFFDEALDPDQFSDPSIFMLDNGGNILLSDVLDPDSRIVTLSVTLEAGVIYNLTILPDYSDCSGNFPAEAQTFQLAIPSEPEAGDVVINEVLFNPGSGGSDFIELFNCSDRVFQIEGWNLVNTQSTSQTSAERTVEATRLFLPGEFLVLTADPEDILQRYQQVDSSLLVDQRLPSLSDDEGNITVSANGVVLDAFDYTEDFHSQLIGDEDGVSLERIRIKSITQDGNNWFSAAQSEGFATPTRANSQSRESEVPPTNQFFNLASRTFSPDGDGFEDFLELSYESFGSPGFLARIRIFDAQGRLVRTLRQVELLASRSIIRWDGSTDDGLRARSGAYVLFVELFNPAGEVREEKLTAVLAGVR